MALNKVAIVGRPNVGKSSLFNRIIGKRVAIVHEQSGVTRDRLEATASWGSLNFVLMDTAGMLPGENEGIKGQVLEQTITAIDIADVLVFLTDVKEGVMPLDMEIADLLRQTSKRVILAPNKADTGSLRSESENFRMLGFDEVIPVSAMHGTGIDDLLDAVCVDIEKGEIPDETPHISIAVVGRPNAGKSTFINAVAGEKRVIVDDVPGTTRDALDMLIEINKRRYLLIDTAGMRQMKKITEGVERYSVFRAQASIRRCDIALLVIDATEGLKRQDKRTVKFIAESGKACVVAVNKWDLITDMTRKEYEQNLRIDEPILRLFPTVFVSSLKRKNIPKVLSVINKVGKEAKEWISTGSFNKMLEIALRKNPPPMLRGKRLKIYYGTQTHVSPPTFLLFVNAKEKIKISYEQYLENRIRDAFGFFGTPIKLNFRKRKSAF